jgi:hypothetical protein
MSFGAGISGGSIELPAGFVSGKRLQPARFQSVLKLSDLPGTI